MVNNLSEQIIYDLIEYEILISENNILKSYLLKFENDIINLNKRINGLLLLFLIFLLYYISN